MSTHRKCVGTLVHVYHDVFFLLFYICVIGDVFFGLVRFVDVMIVKASFFL